MKSLDIEIIALERIKEEWERGVFRKPNIQKIINPLYSNVDTNVNNTEHNRLLLDKCKMNALLSQKGLSEYIEVCKMLRRCGLPEKMDKVYMELCDRLQVLQETVDRYKDDYQPDLYEFYDFYIPEALQITASFLEYPDTGISETILQETEQEIMEALDKLMIGITEKIDEVYKFASIEIKAKAKALDSVMGQNGYVSPRYKFNNTEV